MKPDYRKYNIVYEGIETELLSGEEAQMQRAEKALEALKTHSMSEDDFTYYYLIGRDERLYHS